MLKLKVSPKWPAPEIVIGGVDSAVAVAVGGGGGTRLAERTAPHEVVRGIDDAVEIEIRVGPEIARALRLYW